MKSLDSHKKHFHEKFYAIWKSVDRVGERLTRSQPLSITYLRTLRYCLLNIQYKKQLNDRLHHSSRFDKFLIVRRWVKVGSANVATSTMDAGRMKMMDKMTMLTRVTVKVCWDFCHSVSCSEFNDFISFLISRADWSFFTRYVFTTDKMTNGKKWRAPVDTISVYRKNRLWRN